jgi:hypothetical protein
MQIGDTRFYCIPGINGAGKYCCDDMLSSDVGSALYGSDCPTTFRKAANLARCGLSVEHHGSTSEVLYFCTHDSRRPAH